MKISKAQAEAYGREAEASKVWDWLDGMKDNGSRMTSFVMDLDMDNSWPDLRHPGTFALAYALWQRRPGHVYQVPCPVLTYAAAYGISSQQAIEALVAELKKV
jgi:hypothetical protein